MGWWDTAHSHVGSVFLSSYSDDILGDLRLEILASKHFKTKYTVAQFVARFVVSVVTVAHTLIEKAEVCALPWRPANRPSSTTTF